MAISAKKIAHDLRLPDSGTGAAANGEVPGIILPY
jgi:hypothetical protein